MRLLNSLKKLVGPAPPLSDRRRLGRWGEKRSRKLLESKGLKTVARNYSCRAGEIDLIMARPRGELVFVEVRTRSNNDFAEPEDTINAPKRQRITRAARHFLAVHRIHDRPCRFDIVTVTCGDDNAAKINHYENAFTL